jgi:hypothetical protein
MKTYLFGCGTLTCNPAIRGQSLAGLLRLKQLPDIPTVVDDRGNRIITGSIRLLRQDDLMRINVHRTVENAAVRNANVQAWTAIHYLTPTLMRRH